MNKLPLAKRCQILQMLCEGSSMRSVERVVGVSINTVTKAMVDAGKACAAYQAQAFVGLLSERVQVDEIWAFVAAKAKNVATMKVPTHGAGDIWTWTAIDADTKLVMSWYIGDRGLDSARTFVADIASRIDGQFELTSDGHKSYLWAVEGLMTDRIDYAQVIKIFGDTVEGQKRYSPAECVGIKKEVILGKPDMDYVSTSYLERHNLTIRMSNRRFTRLTNAYSKKVENHAHAFALFAMYYNFVRLHKTLRVSPAMAAGVSKTLWSMEDMVAMVDAYTDSQRAAPTFSVKESKDGWFQVMMDPNAYAPMMKVGSPVATAAEAQAWIATESAAWFETFRQGM